LQFYLDNRTRTLSTETGHKIMAVMAVRGLVARKKALKVRDHSLLYFAPYTLSSALPPWEGETIYIQIFH